MADEKLSYRMSTPVSFRAGENGEATMDFTAATDNPVPIWDWDRGVIDEVLLMSGLSLPSKRQVPFQDSHSTMGISTTLGSARSLETEGGDLLTTVHFARTEKGKEAESLYRDGHMTDVSVGYRVADAEWIPEGEKASIGGRAFEGPVKVVTSWSIRELSAVAIGADEAAKARESIRSIPVTSEQARLFEYMQRVQATVVEVVTDLTGNIIEQHLRRTAK